MSSCFLKHSIITDISKHELHFPPVCFVKEVVKRERASYVAKGKGPKNMDVYASDDNSRKFIEEAGKIYFSKSREGEARLVIFTMKIINDIFQNQGLG